VTKSGEVVIDISPARLKKAWRTFSSSIAVAASCASERNKKRPLEEEALLTTFKARADLRRVALAMESRIKNEEKTKMFEGYWMSDPCAGMKRRKEENSMNGGTDSLE